MRDLDLDEEPIPLGIRGGDPSHWPRYHAALLAEEVVNAVATPAYIETAWTAEQRPPISCATISSIWKNRSGGACDWTEWFASAGLAYPTQARRLAINDYVLVIQAVLCRRRASRLAGSI